MKHIIHSAADLGLLIRAARKSSAVRQDDLAAIVGVSKQFAYDAERGKSTIQLGRVLPILEELGIQLIAEVPDSVGPALDRERAKRAAKKSPSARAKH